MIIFVISPESIANIPFDTFMKYILNFWCSDTRKHISTLFRFGTFAQFKLSIYNPIQYIKVPHIGRKLQWQQMRAWIIKVYSEYEPHGQTTRVLL